MSTENHEGQPEVQYSLIPEGDGQTEREDIEPPKSSQEETENPVEGSRSESLTLGMKLLDRLEDAETNPRENATLLREFWLTYQAKEGANKHKEEIELFADRLLEITKETTLRFTEAREIFWMLHDIYKTLSAYGIDPHKNMENSIRVGNIKAARDCLLNSMKWDRYGVINSWQSSKREVEQYFQGKNPIGKGESPILSRYHVGTIWETYTFFKSAGVFLGYNKGDDLGVIHFTPFNRTKTLRDEGRFQRKNHMATKREEEIAFLTLGIGARGLINLLYAIQRREIREEDLLPHIEGFTNITMAKMAKKYFGFYVSSYVRPGSSTEEEFYVYAGTREFLGKVKEYLDKRSVQKTIEDTQRLMKKRNTRFLGNEKPHDHVKIEKL